MSNTVDHLSNILDLIAAHQELLSRSLDWQSEAVKRERFTQELFAGMLEQLKRMQERIDYLEESKF